MALNSESYHSEGAQVEPVLQQLCFLTVPELSDYGNDFKMNTKQSRKHHYNTI